MFPLTYINFQIAAISKRRIKGNNYIKTIWKSFTLAVQLTDYLYCNDMIII